MIERMFVSTAVMVALMANSALAQTPATVTEEGGGTMDFVVALLVVVLTCFAGFLNPKRSHQT